MVDVAAEVAVRDDADAAHPRRDGGGDTDRRILDRDAQRRHNVERLCCAEVDAGIGLAALLIVRGADGVDLLRRNRGVR